MKLFVHVERGISSTESTTLDFVRAAAALMVFFSHWSLITNNGLDKLQYLGRPGVLLFFVMSGFLIAATSENTTVQAYTIARAARLYSVALPVVIMLPILNVTIQHVAPAQASHFSSSQGLLLQFLASITFANRWWFADIHAFSDGPYWSLSFEAAFYIVWGAFFLSKKHRLIKTALAALLVGPRVLLLFPIWLIGAAFYLSRIRLTKLGALLAIVLAVPLIIVGREYVLLKGDMWEDSGAFLSDWTRGTACLLLIAALFAFNKFSALGIARWIAGRSFTLYLVHFPALKVLMALVGGQVGLADSVAVGVAALAISLGIGSLIEPTAPQYRTALRRLFAIADCNRPASEIAGST